MTKFPDESSAGRGAFLAALLAPRCTTTPGGDAFSGDAGMAERQRATTAARAVMGLQRIAKAEKRAELQACNIPMDDAQKAAAERAAERRAVKASELLKPFRGVAATFGGDPRGPCAWIILDDNPRNGDGWGGRRGAVCRDAGTDSQ